jgi:hypothetical protein
MIGKYGIYQPTGLDKSGAYESRAKTMLTVFETSTARFSLIGSHLGKVQEWILL